MTFKTDSLPENLSNYKRKSQKYKKVKKHKETQMMAEGNNIKGKFVLKNTLLFLEC